MVPTGSKSEIVAAFEREYGASLSKAMIQIQHQVNADYYDNALKTKTFRLFRTDNPNYCQGKTGGAGYYIRWHYKPGLTTECRVAPIDL